MHAHTIERELGSGDTTFAKDYDTLPEAQDDLQRRAEAYTQQRDFFRSEHLTRVVVTDDAGTEHEWMAFGCEAEACQREGVPA